MDRKQVLANMERLEREGKFFEHANPPSTKHMLEVSDDYDYTRKGFWKKIASFFAVGAFKLIGFFVAPYCHLKVVGKENVKNVRRAIVTCNHINNIDCLLIKQAFLHKKIKITVAEFNNFKGIAGGALRSAGTLPFGKTMTTQKNLFVAIKQFLEQDNLVVFYAEGSEWWCYEKPRPLHNGAFFYATKNRVPIIPMFFTFKNLKQRKDGTWKKKFILNIGKPIYPLENAPDKENIEYLKTQNFEWNKNVYEIFYNKKLEYTTEQKIEEN